jgi:hypothetical protein
MSCLDRIGSERVIVYAVNISLRKPLKLERFGIKFYLQVLR